jgi:phage/plasmid-associated DNA primase
MNPDPNMDDYDYEAFDDVDDVILTDDSKETKHIPLELSKKVSSLDKITFLEVVDVNAVEALVQSELLDKEFSDNYAQKFSSGIYANVIAQLNQYKKLYNKKIGAFKVTYNKPRHKYGRVFPNKSLGLTSFSKKIRNTFIKDNYIDLDISNAQPAIVYNICKSNNIECPYIEKYNQKRDIILQEVIDEYDVTRKDAKQLFISLAFFGSFSGWASSLKLDNVKPLKFINMISKELKTIAKVVKKANPDLYETARKLNKDNTLGSFFSLYLQEYETRIMECVIEWLSNKTTVLNFPNTDIKVCTYEFDGIKLLKHNVDKYGLNKLINNLNDIVLETMGFDIKFEEKPIDIGYDIEYTPTERKIVDYENQSIEDGVSNDKEAAEKVYLLYPHWVYCLGTLYVFDSKSGMWSCDNTLYKTIIMSLTDELRVIAKDKNGNIYFSNSSYGSCKTSMEKLPCLIKTLCKNDDWLKQKECSSLGKLLFNNGYLDLKNGFHFYDKETYGFNPDILFMGKINRNFEQFDDEQMEYLNDIKQRLFYNPLGKDVGDYFVLNIARGLMGDMMKRVLFGLGTTDCGKTILTKAIEASLGDYVGAFNAENLLYRKTSNDEGQLMRWALLLRFKRIIISNEMKSTSTINGNMLKKISSGGDSLTGRFHGGNEMSFILHSLAIMMANDLPPISPYDKAVDNRTRVVHHKKQFKDVVEDEENELLKDYNLIDEIKTAKFQNAFVMMLVQAYVKYKEEGEPEEPEDVINGKKEWIGETGDDIDKFLENFDITNDENDFLPTEEIGIWLKEKKIGITSTKMGIEIKKYCKKNNYDNVISKKKKVSGRSIRGYVGIKESLFNEE